MHTHQMTEHAVRFSPTSRAATFATMYGADR